jgi:hypothetical protein
MLLATREASANILLVWCFATAVCGGCAFAFLRRWVMNALIVIWMGSTWRTRDCLVPCASSQFNKCPYFWCLAIDGNDDTMRNFDICERYVFLLPSKRCWRMDKGVTLAVASPVDDDEEPPPPRTATCCCMADAYWRLLCDVTDTKRPRIRMRRWCAVMHLRKMRCAA